MKSSRTQARTIGVFGGAFDPPHLGHALLPALLRARSWVDKVVVAPCADHPLGKTMSPFAHRLGWVRLAMRQHGTFVEVSDIERQLARSEGGPSFTLRLLEAVAAAHPSATVRLVVGSDIVATGEVTRWHRWDEIEARFSPLVVPRVGYADAQHCALPEVSSSRIREALSANDWTTIAEFVPPEVVAQLRQPSRDRVLLIGNGNVAAHAEPWLSERGFDVDMVGGHAVAAAGLRTALDRATSGPLSGPWAGVWILVPDPAIPTIATALLRWGLDPATPILHAAGARPASDVLAASVQAGHPVGTLHPICALRRELPWPSALGEAAFGIEGSPAAVALAQRIVGDRPVLSLANRTAAERVAYHGACALVANHTGVLLASGRNVLVAQGHPPGDVDSALGALLQSAVSTLIALGIPAGITGPAARGDDAAVAAHIEALPEGAAELYAMLSDRLRSLLRPSPTR